MRSLAVCVTHPMLPQGNRSGSLQDGAIVPADLLSSQKGPPSSGPLSNIGSPRDAAILGERGSVFPAIHVLPPQEVFCFQCPAST